MSRANRPSGPVEKVEKVKWYSTSNTWADTFADPVIWIGISILCFTAYRFAALLLAPVCP